MNSDGLSPSDLSHMSTEELVRLGEDSLRDRLIEQATFAYQKYGSLTQEKLDTFLRDADCVRYPTRLVFEFGEMASHQFAQPDVDWRNPDQGGRVLYLRPVLRDHPDLVPLAVAYMLPVLNYGDIIRDEHCIVYGATLLGLIEDEFYSRICSLADLVEAEVRCGSGC
jgi:hypothetical protein